VHSKKSPERILWQTILLSYKVIDPNVLLEMQDEKNGIAEEVIATTGPLS